MKFRLFLYHYITVGLCLFQLACDHQNDDSRIEEISASGKISSIIRSPIKADGTVDTVNVAKMHFEQTVYEFGEVEEGAVVKHVFRFVNNGKVPLLINNAYSTCGCTVPNWPKEMILPGQSGEISVEFNTKGKADYQEKPIIISANTWPNITKLYLKGTVRTMNAIKN